MIVGRSAERDRIARLLKAARRGEGGALLIAGDAGIGKSTLLEEAAQQRRMMVVRTVGSPAESDLSWAGLNSVIAPLSHHLDALPPPQRTALQATLGVAPDLAPDRLAVAAGTLAVLAAAGSEQPLLVVVDDAHWIDQPSAEAIAFVARRLLADPVAVLIAIRSDEPGAFPAHGLDRIELTGLSAEDAQALARAAVPGLVDDVAAELANATQGHPLGLVEVAALLTPEHAAGLQPLPDPVRVGRGVEALYRDRLEAMPEAARSAALVIALGAGPDASSVSRACSELQVGLEALEPVERAGLLNVTPADVRFCHPLVRSAVLSLASPPDLRKAHLAVASTLPAGSDAATWHRAHAVVERDEELAAALDEIGRRELATSVRTAEAAFTESAKLTPDDAVRAERSLRAAQAGWEAGHADASAARIAEALPRLRDAGMRADATHLLAQIEAARGNVTEAAELMVRGAGDVRDSDPARAARMFSDAVEPWLLSGHPELAYQAERDARELAADEDAGLRVEIDLRAADVLGWQGRATEAALLWRSVVDAVEGDRVLLADPWARYRAGEAAFSAGDDPTAVGHLRAALDVAREGGAIGAIPYMAVPFVWALCRMGEIDEAATVAADAVTLAAALGRTRDEAWALAALAWVDAQRGDEEACRRNAERADQLASVLKLDGLEGSAPALGLLELARGAHDAAIAHLTEAVAEHERRGGTGVATPRLFAPLLIEALARAGRTGDALDKLEPFEAAARESERADAIAAALRCRGLVAPDDEALALFEEALTLFESAGQPLEAARTQLCLGERLRRMRRRADARAALRAADAVFSRLGAEAWSARAREELAATGERRRGSDPAERDRLTPHEQQVSRLVATGLTNREVAARLFLSEKTIETHLTRIYLKLGVRSRTALAAAIGAEQERGIPDSSSAASA